MGSVAIGATFALSSIAGMISDKYGIRRVAFVGACIATLGMFLSSFVADHFGALSFTFGILFGGGSSLCYAPSLAILGHYFRKRIGIVNGFVAAGSSVFTFAMPILLPHLLRSIGVSSFL